MAAQNYTLKVTMGEAFVIREGLLRQKKFLEEMITERMNNGETTKELAGAVKELDDVNRVLHEIG